MKLTQVVLTSINKEEGFKINITWQGNTRIEVEGGMLSKLGHDKGLLILSLKLNNGCVRNGT